MTEEMFFDSGNFVVLDIRCNILEEVLKKNGLNLTQYSIMLKCLELGATKAPIQDIAAMLHLQPSLVTRAIDGLEKRSFIQRSVSTHDARTKYITLTSKGKHFITYADFELQVDMEKVFNPQHTFDNMNFLLQGLTAGALIDGIWSEDFVDRYVTSTNLIAVTFFRRDVEVALKKKTGASLSECRILQRLAEVGEPMRISDLSGQLLLPATTITRAATKLEEKGYVQRQADPQDKKAVYLAVTAAGKKLQKIILVELKRFGDERYWGQLSPEGLQATRQIRTLVLGNIEKEKETLRNS